jgi:hypothetical protein
MGELDNVGFPTVSEAFVEMYGGLGCRTDSAGPVGYIECPERIKDSVLRLNDRGHW